MAKKGFHEPVLGCGVFFFVRFYFASVQVCRVLGHFQCEFFP